MVPRTWAGVAIGVASEVEGGDRVVCRHHLRGACFFSRRAVRAATHESHPISLAPAMGILRPGLFGFSP